MYMGRSNRVFNDILLHFICKHSLCIYVCACIYIYIYIYIYICTLVNLCPLGKCDCMRILLMLPYYFCTT